MFVGNGHLQAFHDFEHILPVLALFGVGGGLAVGLAVKEIGWVKRHHEGNAPTLQPLAACLVDADVSLMARQRRAYRTGRYRAGCGNRS